MIGQPGSSTLSMELSTSPHLFPMFCVSIAFSIKGVPVIGLINAPFLHQSFSSCKGRGAWLNGTQRLPLIHNPIPPLPTNAPSGCTFSCEWGKDRRDIPDGNMMRKVNSFLNMASERSGRGGKGGMVHGVRSLGRYCPLQQERWHNADEVCAVRLWI